MMDQGDMGGGAGCSDPKYCRGGQPKPHEELKSIREKNSRKRNGNPSFATVTPVTTASLPMYGPLPTSTPSPEVILQQGPSVTPTPMITPNSPSPQIAINWNEVDRLQALLDGAGIVGDVALIALPEGPGEIVDAGITFIEALSAGKGVIDFIEGHPGNIVQQLATNGIEANLRLLSRSTRWIPLAGSLASGYSLYDNFKGNVNTVYR